LRKQAVTTVRARNAKASVRCSLLQSASASSYRYGAQTRGEVGVTVDQHDEQVIQAWGQAPVGLQAPADPAERVVAGRIQAMHGIGDPRKLDLLSAQLG
jgi:hypothetical protein